MVLILGGVHSGRRTFLNTLHISPECTHTVTAEDARAFAEECCGQTLEPALSLVCARIASFDAVIACEMGLGIIPLEKNNRVQREENGRLNIALAQLADCVVLMTAGLPRVIKGRLDCIKEKKRHLIVFRHGATEANMKKRYAGGATDLDLCGEGRKQVENTKKRLSAYTASLPPALQKQILFPEKIYVSPMKRTLQTAEILYPKAEICLTEDFREMDFGLFENRSADELFSDEKIRPLYQAFVDSGGQMKCPPSDKSAGESIADFLARTARAFESILARHDRDAPVIVVGHGGTQMSLFSQYAAQRLEGQNEAVSSYYGWQTECGMFRFGKISAAL